MQNWQEVPRTGSRKRRPEAVPRNPSTNELQPWNEPGDNEKHCRAGTHVATKTLSKVCGFESAHQADTFESWITLETEPAAKCRFSKASRQGSYTRNYWRILRSCTHWSVRADLAGQCFCGKVMVEFAWVCWYEKVRVGEAKSCRWKGSEQNIEAECVASHYLRVGFRKT